MSTTDEDHKERLDRELIELLNELRVALPGVQVLFAFLLILPFQNGFRELDGIERMVFFASLLVTSAATALLMAPTSWHRLRFRAGDKERMLIVSNRLAIAGSVFLVAAMTLVVYLVTSVLIEGWAAIVAAANALWFAALWFVLPLSRRRYDTGPGGGPARHT